MGTIRRQILTGAIKIFDLVLMVVSFGVATLPLLAEGGPVSFAHFLSIRIKLENFVVFFALLGLWHFMFSILGLYDSKRLSNRRAEIIDVVKATSFGTLVLVLATFVLHLRMVTPQFVAIFWAFGTSAAAISRLILRTWLRQLRLQGRNSRNMLIVGSNWRAIEFAKAIQSKPELGYRIIGFADDEWTGAEEIRKRGWAFVCDMGGLRPFLRRNVVDEVVLAVPLRSFHILASDIAGMCEQQGIMLRVLSDLFNLKNTRSIAEEFEGAALITHYTGIVEGWPVLIKRALDFSLSFLFLILMSPVLFLTAIVIKLTSPGPVLFVQKRVGLNKRTFNIYKFRTMVVNAEEKLREIEHLNEVSGPVFKIKNDPRLTLVGKFLRKTSIDELPQLFNVLKGDMSLVGPRPLQLRDYELFTEGGNDWQRCRFSVRPGITCLWQVNGRSSLPFEQWMDLDLQYINKWSLWLDLQILVKTIPAVLRGLGAA